MDSFSASFWARIGNGKIFFKFFSLRYKIVTWESRLILDTEDRKFDGNEFSIRNHVLDFQEILLECEICNSIVAGYCSGAGIALAAAIHFPNPICNLMVIHGEYMMLDEPTCSTQFASEIDGLLTRAAKNETHLNLVSDKI